MQTAKMLQCLLHFALWRIQHWQIVKFSIAPCQIYNFTLSNRHFYIANLTNLHYFMGCPEFSDCPKYPLAAQFFKKFFLPKLCFFGLFSFGVGGACTSGLPSYLLAYILTNLYTHLLRLPIHLPTYLGVDSYPHLPTI